MTGSSTTHEPDLEQRGAQPYVAIARTGTAHGIPAAVDSGFPELFGWLAEQGIAPTGPPFIRYVVFDPDGAFALEIGAPVAEGVAGDDRVRAGTLPAGTYVTYLHVGAYRATSEQWAGRDLAAAHETVSAWAHERGIEWEAQDTDRGPELRARVERYLVGPVDDPDPATWKTELLFLVRGGAS